VLVFVTWFVLEARGHSTSNPGATASRSTQARGPEAASPADLRSLASSLGHPVYWVGPRANTTYELTVSSSGQVLVRYLPAGTPVGTKQSYLTIATYPVANAFGATSSLTGPGNVTLHIPHGGIAEYPNGGANDIHLAFPGGVVQVEVFDPSASVPPKLVSSGAVVPV
jgi:hypothetical protein